MLNVFIENINDALIFAQVKIARQHRHRDVKLYFDDNTRKSCKLKTWKDINSLKGTTNGINSYYWNINTANVFCDNDIFVLLANHHEFDKFVLLDNGIYPKGRKTFFLDVSHRDDLPDKFYKLPVFNTYADIINYGVGMGLVKSFCLTDHKKFNKTKISQVQGQSVFEEIKTGNLWYLDNFHKDHYEVFDKTGKKHLGEADMDGNLIPDTNKLGRCIKI